MHRRRRNSVSLPSAFEGLTPPVRKEGGGGDTEQRADSGLESTDPPMPSFALDNSEKHDLRRLKYLNKFCRETHSSLVAHRPITKATYTLFPLNEYANNDEIFHELAERIGQLRTKGGLGPHWTMMRADVDIPDPEREGKTQFKEQWPVAKRIAQAKAIRIPPGPASLVAQTTCLAVTAAVCVSSAVALLFYYI